jgi:hypothetical protein
VTNKAWGLDWLLDLFASYNNWLHFLTLALSPDNTVHSSRGHFFGCFSNSWDWRVELSHSLSFLLFRSPSNFSYLSRTQSHSNDPLHRQLREYRKGKPISQSSCSYSAWVTENRCFNKQATNEVPYSLFRESYLRNMPFEIRHSRYLGQIYYRTEVRRSKSLPL